MKLYSPRRLIGRMMLGFLIIATCQVEFARDRQKIIILSSMKEELKRSLDVLNRKGSPPPYFISYQIIDRHRFYINASYGALRDSSEKKTRYLDVNLRVGSHQLDNTHSMRGSRVSFNYTYSRPEKISIENDPDAIKTAIWRETDKKYKQAVKRLIQIKANKGVTVKEEDQSDDFSVEKPTVFLGKMVSISPDLSKWEKQIKEYSSLMNRFPEVYQSFVSLEILGENKFFTSSEGSLIRFGNIRWRLSIFASTKAEDGMELNKFKAFDARREGNLPSDKVIRRNVLKVVEQLIALRNAPLMEPYTGPAILSGGASGVFFHEIFGHRIEGHRQKDESEGQTFTKKINRLILPPFISVYDDPTVKKFNQIDLNGYYDFDDEGIKPSRVSIVEKGILKNFLMSRSPITGFKNSNGHGRSEPGRSAVSRQGNLFIVSSKTVPMGELRSLLIAQCKAEGKPFGLFFEDISGGFTFTGRGFPQSFNVVPIVVYKVFVDGRPDELVRGVELIGTPLTSFSKILACGDKPAVFNGFCGAESGRIPVSAISPSVLTSQIEVQKKFKKTDKPPVMGPPRRRKK